jgi:hypothetical protein
VRDARDAHPPPPALVSFRLRPAALEAVDERVQMPERLLDVPCGAVGDHRPVKLVGELHETRIGEDEPQLELEPPGFIDEVVLRVTEEPPAGDPVMGDVLRLDEPRKDVE